MFDYYGARAFAEFDHFARDSVKLEVIFEGEIPSIPQPMRAVNFSKFENADHALFIKKYGHLYEANGLRIQVTVENGMERADLGWDFRFNAIKFSFKVFSLLQVLRDTSSASHLVWLDADIRVLRPFSKKDLEAFLPSGSEMMAYLGRTNFPMPNPCLEAGWLAFNLGHPETKNFLEFVAQQYVTGEVFTQKEWHDSWIWNVAKTDFEKRGVHFKNLSGPFETSEHPFVNSGLGEYFDHLKGPDRKRVGSSLSTRG